jgi:hypothetical protein
MPSRACLARSPPVFTRTHTHNCPIRSCASTLQGTFNGATGSVSISVCTPCSAGSASSVVGAPSALTCSPCSAGNYSSTSGASQCLSCSSGTFSTAGSSSCSTCPQGSYCPFGIAVDCPIGTHGATTGATNISFCTSCPAGSYNLGTGSKSSASCAACSAGTWSLHGSSVCTACAAGRGSPLGSSSSSNCTTCVAGTSSVGGTACLPCAAGTICPTSGMAAPSLCPPGSYTPVAGRTSCLLCPPGSWTAVSGSAFCDQFCPRGYANADMGGASAESCTACPVGSFGKSDGAVVCSLCPAGTASAATAATSAATCVRCPLGTFAPAGSSSCSACPIGSYPDSTQSSCLVGAYSCPGGFTSASSIVAPTSFASCTKLTCSAPLSFTPAMDACAGCKANYSGAFPNCTLCPAPYLCPGVSSAPLLNFASGIASLITSPCPRLTGPTRLLPVLQTKNSAFTTAVYVRLTNNLSVDGAILGGIALSFAICLLFLATQVLNFLSFVPPACKIVNRLLRSCDFFERSYMGTKLSELSSIENDSDSDPNLAYFCCPKEVKFKGAAPLQNKPRRLGGTFFLLSFITFTTLAVVNVLQYAADNTNVQESVVALTDTRYTSALALPVFSGAPWGSGIQLRITASGDGSQCASPLAWSPMNAGWKLTSATSCGRSGASQLVFSCADCVTSTIVLSVTLHYSCQSLLIEAGAIDGLGSVTSFSLPVSETAAFNGNLLTSISWSLPTLLSVVNSTVSQTTSARGYTMTSGPYSITSKSLLTTSNDGLSILPATSSVSIQIAFPLSTFYAQTLLSEKQSVATLLSNLIGLVGMFSFFGSLLSCVDNTLKCLRKYLMKPKLVPATAPLSARSFVASYFPRTVVSSVSPNGNEDTAYKVTTPNPLRNGIITGAE